MTFKITFNKPATRQFIDGVECGGLEVRIVDGCVQFRPVVDLGSESVELSMRDRGGFEITISGSAENELLAAFKNDAGPYFTLRRQGEWMVTAPYNKDGEPPKFEPHLRLWSKEVVVKNKKQKEVFGEPDNHDARLRWAYAILASHSKGPGRPSSKLLRAKQIIKEEFETA